LYQRALGALQSGDRHTAQTLLVQVVALEPRYEDAARYLHLAVTGVDVAEIEQEMRCRDLAARMGELKTLEKEGRHQDALDLAHKLADEYPGERDWASDLERLERKIHLADLYQRALGALQSGDRQTAETLLAQIIALEPRYEEATRYLYLAISGVDVAELQAQLEAEERAHKEAELIGKHRGRERARSGEVRVSISNPFVYGKPVSPEKFIDRGRELRRVTGRIVNQGQSTAVVGESCSGKTSLLDYLAAPEGRKLYGASEKRLIFSYLDARTLGGEFSQAQFWEHVLRPLQERAIAPNPGSPLAQA
jgi:tetratricopeptide (TPR) repeat protein